MYSEQERLCTASRRGCVQRAGEAVCSEKGIVDIEQESLYTVQRAGEAIQCTASKRGLKASMQERLYVYSK